MAGLELIVMLLTIWFFIYFRVASLVWTISVAAILVFVTMYCSWSLWLLSLSWGIFALVALFVNLAPLRILLLSRPFFKRFKRVLPPMSITEKEALDAGDVWWDGDLFRGRPNWSKLHSIPKPTLTQEEQAFLDNEVEQLCAMLDDWEIVQKKCDLSAKTWQFLKDNGFFGLVISKEYGGKGFSAIAHSSIVTKIATRSMSAAINTMVPNSLGPAELLAHYGTDEQKSHYLPRLAKGQEVPCFALTSTSGGSDAGAMQDYGVVCHGEYNGEKTLGIRLSWSKRYITLAPVATVLGLAFKLSDPERLLGDKLDIGITVALLPTSHPGVKIGQRHYPLNMAFMNGPTEGKDVFIPMGFVIGGQDMLGKGWRMLMECLSIGRSISLPALSAAVGGLSYLTTGIYAELRKQFNVSLNAFEGVQEALAKIAGGTYLLEASRRMTAGAVDLQVKPSVVSAIQKYHATETARTISDAAMDICAGRAIQLGPRNFLAHQYMSLPIAITVEGANILTRNLIIFGQGAVRCHPYVVKEMECASDASPQRGLLRFDKLLKAHIGYAASNVVRAITMGITNARFIKAPKALKRYYRQLTRMSTALALVSDFAMLILGGQLKRKERLSARLGDVLSQLYWASAVIKYYADEGCPEDDQICVEWALQSRLHLIQEAFYDFFANFPNRFIAGLLKNLIFPFGRSYQAPSDALETELVQQMTKNTNLRERLLSLTYAKADKDDVVGRLVAAFNASLEVKPLEAKLKQGIKAGDIPRKQPLQQQLTIAVDINLLTAKEAERLKQVYQQVLDAMEVDVFDKL